jgi:hypothetical protein
MWRSAPTKGRNLEMISRLACLALFAIVSAAPLASESVDSAPSRRLPALVVKVGDKPEALGVSAVKVEARIFGCLAETRMTLTFSNPHERQFEGELYFPLPEG